MGYNKYLFKINTDFDTWSDILVAELAAFEFESFDTNENVLNAYIPKGATFDLKNFQNDLDYIPWDEIEVTFEEVEDQNWNEVWESNFEPIYVGNLIVKAPFHSETADQEIIIQPKMSFGTGHHQTTYLILKMMQEMNWDGQTVLDMGAGTAVLGIYAALNQAKEVYAIDIDEWCFENATENAKLNGVEDIKVLQGGVETIEPIQNEYFDVVLANINRNILTRDMHEYIRTMKKGATIIFSGFYKSDLIHIENKAKEYHLELQNFEEKEDWVAAKFIKK